MTDKELPTEPGWYIPALTAEVGFWNPYLLTPEGEWLEMQSDGHTKTDPEDVFTPLHRLVQVPLHHTTHAALLAEATMDYKSYGPHALGKRLAAALDLAEYERDIAIREKNDALLHSAPVAVSPSEPLPLDPEAAFRRGDKVTWWNGPGHQSQRHGIIDGPDGDGEWSVDFGSDGYATVSEDDLEGEQVTLDPKPWVDDNWGHRYSRRYSSVCELRPRAEFGYSINPADYFPKDTIND